MKLRGLVAALAAALLVLPAAASARKPIISYVDGGQLKLYDSHTAKDLGALPVPIANAATFRYGMSANGRYVFFNDAAKKLHLFDRFKKREAALPGIDIYDNPAFLTVSNYGVVAFDNNANGPAVAYNSTTGQFLPTGLPANNGHRQTQLNGHGGFLATTCMTDCVADLGNDTAPFVQNLITQGDTAAPNVNMKDEEDPCISAAGDLVGWQRANPMQKDIFVYDRDAGSFLSLPGLNNPVDDETFCVLDPGGDYVGFQYENDPALRLYSRATASLIPLPANITAPSNAANAVFSAPKCGGRYATLIGTEGKDRLRGSKGRDVLLGLEGKDRLIGLKGKDILCGGKGKDTLKGGKGKDRLIGGPGKDREVP